MQRILDRLEEAEYIHRDLVQGERGLYTVTVNKYPVTTGERKGVKRAKEILVARRRQKEELEAAQRRRREAEMAGLKAELASLIGVDPDLCLLDVIEFVTPIRVTVLPSIVPHAPPQ
jgi:hypothetical protein